MRFFFICFTITGVKKIIHGPCHGFRRSLDEEANACKITVFV